MNVNTRTNSDILECKSILGLLSPDKQPSGVGDTQGDNRDNRNIIITFDTKEGNDAEGAASRPQIHPQPQTQPQTQPQPETYPKILFPSDEQGSTNAIGSGGIRILFPGASEGMDDIGRPERDFSAESLKKAMKVTVSISPKAKEVQLSGIPFLATATTAALEVGLEPKPKIVYPVTNGVMLAEDYRGKDGVGRADPKGWWASEKWDGVRALWDGRSLWTRAGHMINAPHWFIARLPPGISLDGELFIKHNWFNRTSGIIRNKVPNTADWAPIRYMVFDIPHLGHQMPFEKRMHVLKETVHRWGEPMVFVNQIQIQSAEHLELVHQTLVAQGGEGTMLRQPGSYYHGNTRSTSLLKVKDQFEEDCYVVGWEEGKNRTAGRLGALHVRWCDPEAVWKKFGERWDVATPFHGPFKVGSGLTDLDRCAFSVAKKMYPTGTKIKLAFTQLQKSGKPKHPAFKGVRVS